MLFNCLQLPLSNNSELARDIRLLTAALLGSALYERDNGSYKLARYFLAFVSETQYPGSIMCHLVYSLEGYTKIPEENLPTDSELQYVRRIFWTWDKLNLVRHYALTSQLLKYVIGLLEQIKLHE